ncbi:MAG: sulfatase-like hydrolase/transferase, partial [Terriglobales bacterium]
MRRRLSLIVADLVLWYSLPLLFLTLYVVVLRQPASAILPHFAVVALLFIGVLFLRLLLSRLIANAKARRAVNALVLALCIGSMLLYYAFVLLGLHYWGGVVAWNVIPTFFAQAPDLIDSAGIPRAAVGTVLLAAAVGLLAAWWRYLGRFDWIADLDSSEWTSAILITAGCAIAWAGISNASHAPWLREAEPVSMTLFPLAGARDIEGHPVTAENARLLDALEDRARAAYVPAPESMRRPNLILIVVDALRPDHMSLFGYGRDTTPYLDRLAQSGNVSKVIAHAECGDTICGLLSLTGSKLPQHFSFHPFGIHQVLRRNGYRVHTILAGDHTDFYALKSYYGPVDDWFDGSSAHVRFMNDDQLLIDRTATLAPWDGTPAMIQYHLMSVHIMRKSDVRGEFQPSSNYMLHPSSDTGSTSETLQTATNFYDNGVVAADHVIATLLEQLKQKKYLDDALVVITADHGESLGEHGL